MTPDSPCRPDRGDGVDSVLGDYERLLSRGYADCRQHEYSGPPHGAKGPVLDVWLAQVARPWFAAIEALAAEDGLGVVTYQGFDEYISGSTPCAALRGRDGGPVHLSTQDPDRDATLLALCGDALRVARARRGV